MNRNTPAKVIKKVIPKAIRVPLEHFIHTESASGIILAVCTVIAMIIANSPFSIAYAEFFEFKVFGLSIHHLINDGLMTIFFFVVGMEIKKEMIAGELSTFRKAALPIAAALGGMIIPALIYLFFNFSTGASHGWAIPMATDIAFALGVLTLFGARVPLSLKVFLLALAIVDDLGAVVVIAFFYTDNIKLIGLAVLALAMVLVILAKYLRFKNYFIYVILGIVAWAGTLYSGVHATIAGVLIGLLTPYLFQDNQKETNEFSPLDELIEKLHPWVSFGIMPVFALANAGISLRGADFGKIAIDPIFSGVWLGLLLGKPLGIMVFSFLSVAFGFAVLPKGLRWNHIVGVSILAGIGFTMALFISGLSMSVEHTVYAKMGILFGSLVAGILGFIWLSFTIRKYE
jgi:Na+:H+ antiporter, NhaA family